MPRAPLGQISGNQRRNIELIIYERAITIGARIQGALYKKIVTQISRPISTIATTLQRDAERVNGATKPRSGRPKKLTDRDERKILRIIRTQPKLKYTDII
jgi:transposase